MTQSVSHSHCDEQRPELDAWTIPALPATADLMALGGATLPFVYQGQAFLARFSTEGTLYGGLDDEAAIFQAIGDHPNIQSCIGIKKVNGVSALVFRDDDCLPFDTLLHNVSLSEDASVVAGRSDVLRFLAHGLLSGVNAVHEAGYACGDLQPSDISVSLPTMEVKLRDLSTACALGTELHTQGEVVTHTFDNEAICAVLRTLQGLDRSTVTGSPEYGERDVWPEFITSLLSADPSRRESPRSVLARGEVLASPPSALALEMFRTAACTQAPSTVLEEARCEPDRKHGDSALETGLRKDDAASSASDEDECFFDVEWRSPESPRGDRIGFVRSPSISSTESEAFVDAIEGVSIEAPFGAASHLIRAFTHKMLLRVIADVLARYAGVHALYRALTDTLRASDDAEGKIERLISLLHEHRDKVPKGYLTYTDAITRWLTKIQHLMSIGETEAETGGIVRTKRIVAEVRMFLEDPDVAALMSTGTVERITPFVRTIQGGIALLEEFSSLDQAASFGEFLHAMLASPMPRELMGPEVHDCLQQTASALDIVSTVSSEGQLSGSDTFGRLIATLSEPAVVSRLEDRLPDWRTSPAFIALAQMRDFPLAGSYSQQMDWLVSTCQQSAVQLTLKPIVDGLSQGLGADAKALGLLESLLELMNPDLSYREKAISMVSRLASALSLETIYGLARPVLSRIPYVSPLLSTLESAVTWYARQPSDLSWSEMSTRFYQHVTSELGRSAQTVAGMLAIPGIEHGAQAIASYLNKPDGMSWEQTIVWAGEQAVQHPAIKPYFDRYMQVSLLWKLSGVFRESASLEQQELALGEVAHTLKQYLSTSPYPGLSNVVDVLPYLPALLRIAPKCRELPADASWTRWAEGVIDIVAHSNSPALKRLGEQLEAQVEDALSDGLMRGLDQVAGMASAVASGAATAIGAAMSGVVDAAKGTLELLSNVPDPLSLKFMVAEAATTSSITPEQMMQLKHTELVNSGTDPDVAEQSVKKHFETATARAAPDGAFSDSNARAAETTAHAGTTLRALTQDELAHLADGFDPFADIIVPLTTAEKVSIAALSVSWLATAYLAYSTYAQYHATKGKEPSATEMLLLSQGSRDEVDQPGFVRRAARPLAFAGMLAVSIGATYAVVRHRQDDLLDVFGEGTPDPSVAPAAPSFAALDGAHKVRRSASASWAESMRTSLSSNYGQIPRERLRVLVNLAIQATLDANVAPNRQTAHFLRDLDSRLAKYFNDSLASRSSPHFLTHFAHELACVHQERMRVRFRLETELAKTSIVRTGPSLVPPPLDLGTQRYDEAFELQEIDGRLYEDALRRCHEASWFMLGTDRLGRAYYDQKDIATVPAFDDALLSYSPRDNMEHLTNLYDRGIRSVDDQFLRLAIDSIHSSGKTISTLISNVIDKFRLVRFNIGQAIYAEREKLATGRMSSAEASLSEARIRMEQVAKHHVTVLFNQTVKYLEMLGRLPSTTFSRRLTPDRAIVDAKVEAARLTIEEFAIGPIEAMSDKDLYHVYTELRESGDPNIQWYVRNAASLLYAIFAGGVAPEVRRLGQQKETSNPFPLKDYQSPEHFFPWRKSMMEFFRKADVPTVKRLTDPDPPDFRGVESFKRSNALGTWKAYFEQFEHYADRDASIQAKKYSYGALVDAGLDDYDMSLTPKSVHVLQLVCTATDRFSPEALLILNSMQPVPHLPSPPTPTPPSVPGLLGVIELPAGEVVVVASLEGRAMAKRFSREETQQNAPLRQITSGSLERMTPYRCLSAEPLIGRVLVDNLIAPMWGTGEMSPLARNGRFAALIRENYSAPYDLDVSGRSVLALSDEIMTQGLLRVAKAVKAAYMDNTVWHSMASMFIPFYSTAFNAHYDRDSQVDVASVILDVLSVVAVLVPAGIELSAVARTAGDVVHATIINGLKAGHRGAALIQATARSLAGHPQLVAAGMSASQISLLAAYDMVEPLPFRAMSRPIALKVLNRVRAAGAETARLTAETVTLTHRGKSLTLNPAKWGESTNPLALSRSIQQQLVAEAMMRDVSVPSIPSAPSLKLITYEWWNSPEVVNATGKNQALRKAARDAIISLRNPAPGDLVFQVLRRAGDFPRSTSISAVLRALRSSPRGIVLESSTRVRDIKQLMHIPPGNVVFFSKEDSPGALGSVMVSIGDGWFAGVRNAGRIPADAHSGGGEASMLTAKELIVENGVTTDDTLYVHFGPCMGARRRPIPRWGANSVEGWARRVIGDDSDFAFFAASEGEVALRAHGAAFNINRMDAIEVGHFIKGEVGAQRLHHVHLISCHGAKDFRLSNISSGQVLADFLNVNVTAYAGRVSSYAGHVVDHPVGRVVFRPRILQQGPSDELTRKIAEDRLRHMRWHNFMGKVLPSIYAVRNSLRSIRQPRAVNSQSIDAILLEIVHFVVGNTSVSEFFRYMNPGQSPDERAANFRVLSIFAENATSASDEECLLNLLAIFSMKPEWLAQANLG